MKSKDSWTRNISAEKRVHLDSKRFELRGLSTERSKFDRPFRIFQRSTGKTRTLWITKVVHSLANLGISLCKRSLFFQLDQLSLRLILLSLVELQVRPYLF